jgi:hypothetical protein
VTNERVKSTGWSKDIDVITESQITNLDINLAKCLDGFAGGSYTPTADLRITGQGIGTAHIKGSVRGRSGSSFDFDSSATLTVNLGSTVRIDGTENVASGGVMNFADGSLMEMSVGATIANTTNQTLSPLSGEVRRFADPTTFQMDHDMVAAGNVGRKLWLVRPANGANAIVIRRSGFAGDAIVTLPVSTWSSVLLVDDGTNWRVAMHTDALPGAES